MKKLFLLNGLVVGHATSFDGSAHVSCNIEGAIEHEVATDSPIIDGWEYTEVDGVYAFTHSLPMNRKPTPIEFKLLFTSTERLAINEKLKDDPVLKDFFSILDDPRLKFVDLDLQSNKEALMYLEGNAKVLEKGRAAEILKGFPA